MTRSGEARFLSLYETYRNHVAAYCRRRASADHVDDLVAEVFLTVWRKIDDAPDDEEALPWIYRISYLVLTNHWRGTGRKKRLHAKLESLGVDVAHSPQDQVVIRDELRAVLEAAQRLRPRDQEILRLSLWEHLPHDQIGAVLGIEPNAAKQRLHRARKALVREYEHMSKGPQFSPAAQEGGEW